MDSLVDVPEEFLEGTLEELRAEREVVRRRLSELEVGHLDEVMADEEARSGTKLSIVRDELLLLDAVVETLEVRLGRRGEVSVELSPHLQKRAELELRQVSVDHALKIVGRPEDPRARARLKSNLDRLFRRHGGEI